MGYIVYIVYIYVYVTQNVQKKLYIQIIMYNKLPSSSTHHNKKF